MTIFIHILKVSELSDYLQTIYMYLHVVYGTCMHHVYICLTVSNLLTCTLNIFEGVKQSIQVSSIIDK